MVEVFAYVFCWHVLSTVQNSQYGEANFDADPGDGTVYVRGNVVKKGLLSSMVVVYV